MSSFDRFLKKASEVADSVVYTGVTAVRTLEKSKGPVRVSAPGAIEFSYVGTDELGDYRGVTYYSDSYFSHPGTDYDNELGTASIALAMACGTSHQGYTRGYVNAEALIRAMGFSDVRHNTTYEEVPSMDTMGVIIGAREVPGCTILCVGLRGICYGSEWGANLLLGKGELHQGFDEASNLVIGYLREYVRSKSLSGRVKIWITGYSRSASVANLVAAKMDSVIPSGLGELLSPDVSMTVDDIYAYCFEPAETVQPGSRDVHAPCYRNIWNHVNPCDPVPILVTKCFGMERFGTDLVFPCPSDTNYPGRRDRMLSFFNSLENREQIGHYRIDHFAAVEVESGKGEGRKVKFADQAEFITRLNECFSECLGSRENYVDNIQAGLAEVIADNRTITGYPRLEHEFRSAMSEDKLAAVAAVLALEKNDRDGVWNSLSKPVSRAVRAAEVRGVTDDQVTTAMTEVLFVFKDFFRGNRFLFLNFLVNSKTIFSAHYPELSFAWMMSNDQRYIP